jgi:hypothetical protein
MGAANRQGITSHQAGLAAHNPLGMLGVAHGHRDRREWLLEA